MTGESAYMDPGACFNGGCARCLNGSSPLRNTEIDVPYEPAIALCEGCVRDLALAFGLVGVSDETSPALRRPIGSRA